MILVTGANGFVGSALQERLSIDGRNTRASIRRPLAVARTGVQYHFIDGMTAATDWSLALKDVQAVVHCAARVHVMDDLSADPLRAYREVNVSGTLKLASQAARAGVRRFVFVSSIKVNGEATPLGRPFTAEDAPAPLDPYGVSKWEAERGLREIEALTGMEVVTVRPPLVYGPGVKANFASLIRWVNRGVPLPFGAVRNARSMVALDNLVDLLTLCIEHPAAAGNTFLVSDDEDVSTPELLQRTAKSMGKRSVLLPVPVSWLEFGAALLGRRALAQRLFSSLQVDIAPTRQLLGWNPPLTLDQGLEKAVRGSTL